MSGCNHIFRVYDEIDSWTPLERERCLIHILCSDKHVKPHLYVDDYSLDEIEAMFPNVYAYLKKHENVLRLRKIKKITNHNWYKWGAIRNWEKMIKPKNENYIYVKNKSRQKNPFWIGKSGFYDGSIIALCPRNKNITLEQHVKILNSCDGEYRRRNILTNTKYSFTQSMVTKIPLI